MPAQRPLVMQHPHSLAAHYGFASCLHLIASCPAICLIPSHAVGLLHSMHSHLDRPLLATVVQVAAEALRVCEQMVSVVRPNPPAPPAADLEPLVSGMFACINGRLAAQDQDQEVKECAILCMAHLVATCGDLLSAEVSGSVGQGLWACRTCRRSALLMCSPWDRLLTAEVGSSRFSKPIRTHI